MDWFAVYETETGRLVFTGRSVASDKQLAGRGLEKRFFAFDPRSKTKQWNEATKNFDDVVPPMGKLSPREFLDRFAVKEREDIFDAARNGSAVVKKKLDAFLQYLKLTGSADPNNQYVIDSINLMETSGIIGLGRAAAISGD